MVAARSLLFGVLFVAAAIVEVVNGAKYYHVKQQVFCGHHPYNWGVGCQRK